MSSTGVPGRVVFLRARHPFTAAQQRFSLHLSISLSLSLSFSLVASALALSSSPKKVPPNFPAIDFKGFETRAIQAGMCQALQGYLAHKKQPPPLVRS